MTDLVTKENANIENEKTTSAFLYFSATIANLNNITLGVMIIWISPVTSKLLSYNEEENPLGRPVTTLELSLIGSLPAIGMVIGPIFLAKIFDEIGRKRSLNVLSVLIVACFVTLAFAKHIYLYFAVILLIGSLLGGTSVGLSMYTSEITEDHNRGKMSCYSGLFMPLGNLYGFLLGPFLSVKVFTLLSALPSIILIIISSLFLPESPQYFINKNKKEDALKTLRKLLGSNYLEAEKVSNQIEYNKKEINKLNQNSIKVIFTRKSTRNGIIICCVLNSMPACTGLAPVMSYLEPIFEMAGTEISGSICAIFVGVLQIFCCFTASVLVEKWGRRPLLLVSAAASTLPLSILGSYFFLINIDSPLVINIRWVPILGVILLMITAVTGVCSVSGAILNEVFTDDVKSTAISFVYFVTGICIAVFVFLFPIMMDTIGLAWSFWIFVILCMLAFVFIYFRIPETKGKNILEIQQHLEK